MEIVVPVSVLVTKQDNIYEVFADIGQQTELSFLKGGE